MACKVDRLLLKREDGTFKKIGIIVFAAAEHSCECAIGLLNLATNRQHESAHFFVNFAINAMDQLPEEHQGFKTLVNVMEAFMEPADLDDANKTIEKARHVGSHTAMADLLRRVSLRYIAKVDQDALEAEVGEVVEPRRKSLRM
jgi:hypothetical protein